MKADNRFMVEALLKGQISGKTDVDLASQIHVILITLNWMIEHWDDRHG